MIFFGVYSVFYALLSGLCVLTCMSQFNKKQCTRLLNFVFGGCNTLAGYMKTALDSSYLPRGGFLFIEAQKVGGV